MGAHTPTVAPEAATALLARMPTSVRAERARRYSDAMASAAVYHRRGWAEQERRALDAARLALTMPQEAEDECCVLCLRLVPSTALHRRGPVGLCDRCYVEADEFEASLLSD